MNLRSKKQLAANTFKVGKERIAFVKERMGDIKEAITKQDMRDLKKDGAIIVKEIKGRSKNVTRKRRRGVGKVKRKVNKRKQNYVILTRKLRKVVKDKKLKGELNKEEAKEIRKKIRNKIFRSKAHLKERMEELKKWRFKN